MSDGDRLRFVPAFAAILAGAILTVGCAGTGDPAPGTPTGATAPPAAPTTAPSPTPAAAATMPPATNAASQPCAEQAGLLGAVEGALQRRPEDATLHFLAAGGWAACGNAERTVAALQQARQHGDGFLPMRDERFEKVWDDPAFRAERAAMEKTLPVVGSATETFRVRDRTLIPEGIAFDRVRRRLFMGSIATGRILVVDGGGQRDLARAPADAPKVLGLALDATGRRLYAVVTDHLGPAATTSRNAVLELDADSGKLLRRLDAVGATQLNDLAVASDGSLFVTDSSAGGLWRAAPGATALELWLPGQSLPGPNGIALAAGERALYVAHATGIARVERDNAAITPRLANPTRETIAVIDGLYRHGNTLVGVQNYTNPGRVIAIDLDAAGTAVTGVRTLLSHHHPVLADPTTGALDGDRFLLLANSFVARLQPDGTVRDAATLAEPVVLAVPLR